MTVCSFKEEMRYQGHFWIGSCGHVIWELYKVWLVHNETVCAAPNFDH
jgi:hypothetical protein